MKKLFPAVFAIFCVAVCLVPSLGMIVRPTTEPIGNERKSKAPELTKKDGSVNFSYLTDLGGYYEKHFAFRPEMITADATVPNGDGCKGGRVWRLGSLEVWMWRILKVWKSGKFNG